MNKPDHEFELQQEHNVRAPKFFVANRGKKLVDEASASEIELAADKEEKSSEAATQGAATAAQQASASEVKLAADKEEKSPEAAKQGAATAAQQASASEIELAADREEKSPEVAKQGAATAAQQASASEIELAADREEQSSEAAMQGAATAAQQASVSEIELAADREEKSPEVAKQGAATAAQQASGEAADLAHTNAETPAKHRSLVRRFIFPDSHKKSTLSNGGSATADIYDHHVAATTEANVRAPKTVLPEGRDTETIITGTSAVKGEITGTQKFSPISENFTAAKVVQPLETTEENPKQRKTTEAYRIPIKSKNLSEAMELLRRYHRLPEELLMDQTAAQHTWLISQIKKAEDPRDLENLAFSFTYKELAGLFPAMATLKKKDEIESLQTIIRLRPSHFLYLCGWITFQYSYPRTQLAKALADLCVILEDISYKNLKTHSQSNLLKRPKLSENNIYWDIVPMISDIVLPGSRQFVYLIAQEMADSDLDPDDFFMKYAIFPNLALGKEITDKYVELINGVSQNPYLTSDFFERFRRKT